MRRLYNYISSVALLATIICGCSAEPAHIYGNITGLEDGSVYLRSYEGGGMRTLDQVESVAGSFTFTMPPILPNILYLQFGDNISYFIPVIIEETDVSVSGNMNYYDEITVAGTAANDALGEHRNQVRRHDILLRTIEQQLDATDSISAENHVMLTTKRDSLKRLIARCRREFVEQHRGSIVSAYLVSLSLSDKSNLSQIDSLLGELDPTMADNAFMRQLKRRAKALRR